MTWFAWQNSALVLNVALQPGAKRDEFVGLHGDALKIRIQAPPLEGRANQALIEFLAATFDCPRANITLLRGAASRRKVMRVDRPNAFPQALQQLGLHAPSGDTGY
ncbi:MAG TPA: DUF167 family protein [Steroidobacteraceae bacterium]|nr:DUF167 family protein [Steroidobacteraceae bacterium]